MIYTFTIYHLDALEHTIANGPCSMTFASKDSPPQAVLSQKQRCLVCGDRQRADYNNLVLRPSCQRYVVNNDDPANELGSMLRGGGLDGIPAQVRLALVVYT